MPLTRADTRGDQNAQKQVPGCKRAHASLCVLPPASGLLSLSQLLLCPMDLAHPLLSRMNDKSEHSLDVQSWLKEDQSPEGTEDFTGDTQVYEKWAAANQASFESYYGQVQLQDPIKGSTSDLHMCISRYC